jgi:lycopene cyclase-like protein
MVTRATRSQHVVPAVVLGSGPAAYALAAALCLEGIECSLIAPHPNTSWPQTYSMWTDQFSEDVARICGSGDPWLHRWDRVLAIGQTEHAIGREYATIDNERLRLGLLDCAEATGNLRVITASVVSVEPVAGSRDQTDSAYVGEVILTLSKGKPVRANLVFDGTGASSKFVQRDTVSGSSTPAVLQTAFGRTVSATNVPFNEGTCVLMDWRGANRTDASFLYALSFGDGRWLFEETSLAKRGGLPLSELERRLGSRLDELGIRIKKEHVVERVEFPMDVALPSRSQRIIGIGAAAALVHPATGYSIAASLRSAPRLAKQAASILNDSSHIRGASQQPINKCAEVLWSDDRRRARGLETYGLQRLLAMDQVDTCAFFDTFFSLPTRQTIDYLSGEATSKELSAVMWNVFRRAPRRLQQRLATGNPLMLARALLR